MTRAGRGGTSTTTGTGTGSTGTGGAAAREIRPWGKADGIGTQVASPSWGRVVAWAQRVIDGQGQWLRWQSPPLQSRAALDQAWQKAALWAQNPSDEDRLREVRTVPLSSWQIFYFRNNAWSNPLSSADGPDASTPDAASAATVPDGVRLVLVLPAGQAVSGSLTRDWVRPLLGGGK